MNTWKTKINNYLSKYCLFIFAIITLLIMFHRVPFWDETHAFNIARLNLSEIFYLTRIEGHPTLWYLILKPFSGLNLYPWSMFIINWLFCLGALFVMWKKAPFSPIIKTFITFSTPFLYYFAPVARCYSLGLLFLFLICAYYKKRFKKPYFFATLISITANTSILAGIGAFYIGLIFLHDLILKVKNKTISTKILFNVIGIFALCLIILILQFFNIRKLTPESPDLVLNAILNFAIFPHGTSLFPFILHIIVAIAFYYFTFVIFKNSKRGLFFALGTFGTLTYIFLKMYSGSHWNHYFYFIYFIMLFWIFKKQLLRNKFSKILFTTILFLFIFPKAVLETGKMDLIYASKSDLIAKQIIENPNYKNAKLYTLEWWSDLFPGASLYLAKEGINIYDLHNRNKRSFEGLKNIFYIKDELIDFDNFVKNMDKNSYLLTAGSLFEQKFSSMLVIPKENGDFIFQTKTKKYLIKQIEDRKKTGIGFYKISEI